MTPGRRRDSRRLGRPRAQRGPLLRAVVCGRARGAAARASGRRRDGRRRPHRPRPQGSGERRGVRAAAGAGRRRSGRDRRGHRADDVRQGSSDLGQPRRGLRLRRGRVRPLERARGDERRGRLRRGRGRPELPLDDTNLAVRAYALLADPAGKQFRFVNRIPLERGLGSSAAAIALGLVAAAPHASAEELLAAGLTLEPMPTTSRPRSSAASRSRGTGGSRGSPSACRSTRSRSFRASEPRPRAPGRRSPPPCRTTEAAASAGRAALLGAARRAAMRRSSPPRSTTGCTSRTALRDPRRDPRRPAAGLRRRDAVRIGPDGDRLGPPRRRGAPPSSRAACRTTRSSRSTSPARGASRERPSWSTCARAPAYEAGHIPGSRRTSTPSATSRRSVVDPAVGGRHPLPGRRRARGSRRARRDRAQTRSSSRSTTAPAGPRAAGGFSATSATTRGHVRARRLPRPAHEGRRPRRRAVPSSRGRARGDTITADEILARLDDPSLALLDARSRDALARRRVSRSTPSRAASPARSTPRSTSRSPTARSAAPPSSSPTAAPA